MTLPLILLFVVQVPAADPVALLEAGRLPDAERVLRSELARAPSDPRALMLMGVVLDSSKRYAEAEPFYRRAVRAAPDAAPVWNNFGNHWMSVGKPDEARKAFERVVAIDPSHPNATLQLQVLDARDRVLKKDYAGAESAYASLLDRMPGNFDILYNLGLAALNAGHRDRAIDVFTAARRQRPDDPDVLVSLARACVESGRVDESIALLTEVRRIAPKREDALALLARVCTYAGFHADAAEAWKEYLKLRPEDEVARREMGFALVRDGNQKEGVPELERFVAQHPKDPIARFELAVAYTVDDRAKAIEQASRAIELKPDYAEALYVRGTLAAQDGRDDAAIADLQQALKVQPDNARALDELGQVYRTMKRKDEAEQALRRASELAPNDGPIAMHYALVLRDQGKRADADKYLAKFREVGSDQKRMPPRGLLEFFSLPPAEQRQRYVANLKRALQDSPTTALRLRLGSELLKEGDYAEAKKVLQEAGDAGALDLALAEYHLNGPAAGINVRDRTPEPKRDGDYWLLRAQMLDAQGNAQAAAEALNRGFAAAPTRSDLFYEAALFLVQHERLADAARLLEQATKKLPDEPELRLLQDIVHEVTGREQEAIESLRSIEQRWPEWDRPRVVRGIALAKRAQYAEARKEIETAIALGADGGEAYYYLADLILNTTPNDIAGASAAVQRALERSPMMPMRTRLRARSKPSAETRKAPSANTSARRRSCLLCHSRIHSSRGSICSNGDHDEAAAEADTVRRLMNNGKEQSDAPPFLKSLFRVGYASDKS